MKRLMIASFAVAFVASGAFAATKPHGAHPAKPAAHAKAAPVKPAITLDETHFLQAADDSSKRGDHSGAVQLLQSAIIYAPSDPVPYQRLAQLYVKDGQSELAQQYFGIALDVQPAYPPALEGIAMLDLASGNRAGAQMQHDILVHACGTTCPETAHVEKALNGGDSGVDRRASDN
jgi:tetratricopeptide (TPR) repeat protein